MSVPDLTDAERRWARHLAAQAAVVLLRFRRIAPRPLPVWVDPLLVLLRAWAEEPRACASPARVASTSLDTSGDTGEHLLTIRQAARYLVVSESTVKRMLRDGRLRAVAVGSARRVHPDDLDAFIGRLPAA